ncbi:hypothetical protein RHMOL_Rhmol12G0115400 [Rhododendron molle]|uniref:Uncharacterized protein n=1 Tax=Rhododendron molle TaxID=49168 RepID=A0ACC0LH46_RHOML|nr:hypothetical protein RHMOL_Rhmol12G0115400 [Rhododendron molle]
MGYETVVTVDVGSWWRHGRRSSCRRGCSGRLGFVRRRCRRRRWWTVWIGRSHVLGLRFLQRRRG